MRLWQDDEVSDYVVADDREHKENGSYVVVE
jgi:hypothetical protein